MTEYLGKKYVPVEQDFFEAPAELVAPRLIGCVLHHDNRGEDTAIMIAEGEAYSPGDRAAHCHPDAPLHVRTRSVSQLLPPGHAYIHGYGNMLFLDLVCDAEGRGSSVLICAAAPWRGSTS
jgi:DNA-3-methyladenine glycosylase